MIRMFFCCHGNFLLNITATLGLLKLSSLRRMGKRSVEFDLLANSRLILADGLSDGSFRGAVGNTSECMCLPLG